MPRKIRQLVSELAKAGFMPVPGGKGSHRKFRHARLPGSVILSGADGDEPQAQPGFLTVINLNQCVPAEHPLRAIKSQGDAVLKKLPPL